MFSLAQQHLPAVLFQQFLIRSSSPKDQALKGLHEKNLPWHVHSPAEVFFSAKSCLPSLAKISIGFA